MTPYHIHADSSQVVTCINSSRKRSPPGENPKISPLPIRLCRTFGSWDCVVVGTLENVCIKSGHLPEYTQAHHLLIAQAFHMIEIFSYTRIFPLFLIHPATYQSLHRLDPLLDRVWRVLWIQFQISNGCRVGGIWEAGDAPLNRERSPPYLQLLLSSRLERRENRVALAAIRESTHPILSKPFGKEKEKISRIILTAALDPMRDCCSPRFFLQVTPPPSLLLFLCVPACCWPRHFAAFLITSSHQPDSSHQNLSRLSQHFIRTPNPS